MNDLPAVLADHGDLVLFGAVALFLVLITAFTYVVFGLDKHQAEADRRRVSEGTLLVLALAGGSLGAKLGQRQFDHKTRKQPFGTLLNLILVAQLGLVGLYMSPLGPRATEMAGNWAGEMFAGLAPEPEEPARALPRRFGPGS